MASGAMSNLPFRKVLILAVVAASLAAGCSDTRVPGVYRIDIQQGNIVTQEMLNQLEPGMEQRKVRFILGSPMLVDVFNQNRWDYVYEFRSGGGGSVQRRVALFFVDERLERIAGSVQFSGTDAHATGQRNETVVSVPDMPRKGGFFSALNPLSADDPVALPSPSSLTADQSLALSRTVPEVDRAPTNAMDSALNAAESKSPQASTESTEMGQEDDDGGFFRQLVQRLGWKNSNASETETDPGNWTGR